jgi:hypothetical protein
MPTTLAAERTPAAIVPPPRPSRAECSPAGEKMEKSCSGKRVERLSVACAEALALPCRGLGRAPGRTPKCHWRTPMASAGGETAKLLPSPLIIGPSRSCCNLQGLSAFNLTPCSIHDAPDAVSELGVAGASLPCYTLSHGRLVALDGNSQHHGHTDYH